MNSSEKFFAMVVVVSLAFTISVIAGAIAWVHVASYNAGFTTETISIFTYGNPPSSSR